MAEKEVLRKVQFWIGEDLKREIDDFAHGLNLTSADFYKAGAILLRNVITKPNEVTVNLFTRSFKDFENKEIQKKILKQYRESKSIY